MMAVLVLHIPWVNQRVAAKSKGTREGRGGGGGRECALVQTHSTFGFTPVWNTSSAPPTKERERFAVRNAPGTCCVSVVRILSSSSSE
jgi:hypothetical protein